MASIVKPILRLGVIAFVAFVACARAVSQSNAETHFLPQPAAENITFLRG